MALPNIYTSAASELPQKVVDYITHLDSTGQVDRDSNGEPYITSFSKVGSGCRVKFIRNGFEENFFTNYRKRPGADGLVRPERLSCDLTDGYKRKDEEKKRVVADPGSDKPKGERTRKPAPFLDYQSVAESIVCDD